MDATAANDSKPLGMLRADFAGAGGGAGGGVTRGNDGKEGNDGVASGAVGIIGAVGSEVCDVSVNGQVSSVLRGAVG